MNRACSSSRLNTAVQLPLLRLIRFQRVVGWLGVIVLVVTAFAADELVAIDFRNRIPGGLDAPVYDFDGVSLLVGPHETTVFMAQLFLSAERPDSLAPFGGFQMFGTGTNAGYWEPQVMTLLPEYGVSIGKEVFYSVRVLQRLPVGPFGEYVTVGTSPDYSMVVTNAVMPLVGFKSFSLLREQLRIRRQGDQVVVEWYDLGARRYDLDATSGLQPPIQWQTVFTRASYGDPYEVISVTNALTSTPQFYRLRRER